MHPFRTFQSLCIVFFPPLSFFLSLFFLQKKNKINNAKIIVDEPRNSLHEKDQDKLEKVKVTRSGSQKAIAYPIRI